ncbi:HEPN domain-containing protein [Parvimonas micra]
MNDNFMMFDSSKKFYGECSKEVEKLIELSTSNQELIQLFISSAVVLLGAKFESCIENLIEEYVNKINDESSKNKVPDELKFSSIYNKLVEYKERINNNHYDCFETDQNFLDEFSKFVNGIINNSNRLKINNKFSYGKHGYKELVKLFKNIAVDIRLDNFNIYVRESIFSGVSHEITFESEFNKFTKNRNTVIHENECPNITGDDIKNTVIIFKEFISKIESELCDRLKNMKE